MENQGLTMFPSDAELSEAGLRATQDRRANKLLRGAELVDAYRVFPRVFLIGYGWLALRMCEWAMALPAISIEQMGLVTAVAGLFVPLTGWYMQTGRKW